MTMNMRFFIIAAAATLLAACTQENEVQNNPVEARITYHPTVPLRYPS